MNVVQIILKVIITLACIAITAFILLQPGKDGMSSAITGLNDDANYNRTARKSRPEMRYAFLTKVLGIAIGVLCLVSVFLSKF